MSMTPLLFGMVLKSCALTRCIEKAASKIGWGQEKSQKAGKIPWSGNGLSSPLQRR